MFKPFKINVLLSKNVIERAHFLREAIFSYLEMGNNHWVLNLINNVDAELKEFFRVDDESVHACIIMMEEEFFVVKYEHFSFTA